MAKKSVLIIKHGFSETCDQQVSPVVSYGDVFRCTCLLEDFKGWHVTWITSQAAVELIADNHLVDTVVAADHPDQLDDRTIKPHYNWVINLEKHEMWCEFAAEISADQRYGFKDWSGAGQDCFYPDSAAALSGALRRRGYWPLQQTLFETIGRQWHGQRYVLGYRPRVTEIYDIGLNHHVGAKWPVKAWPKSKWVALHGELERQGYALCWQQSLHSIRHYIDWLASCRTVVTNDSLGLHLALALGKRVVALFGPTAAEQVHLYGQGLKLVAPCDRSCVPCFRPQCKYSRNCMDYITLEMVLDAVGMMAGEPRHKSRRLAFLREGALVEAAG